MSLPTITPAAVAISFATIAIIAGLKQVRPHWPGMLIAVAATSVAASMAELPISTIGTAFGGIPTGVPVPALPGRHLGQDQRGIPQRCRLRALGFD